MAKSYSQDQAQGAEEAVAKKLDGRMIPIAGIALFVLLAIVLAVFAMNRRSSPPATPSEAIQNAPLASPGTSTGR